MIEIITGHDCSSYFWINLVRFNYIENSETQDYWDFVEHCEEKEISIEESNVEHFLNVFFKKHFNKKLKANIIRDKYIALINDEKNLFEPDFIWNLEYNFYSFDDINYLIKDIEDTLIIMLENYDDLPDNLKKKFDWLAYLNIDTRNKTQEELYEYAKNNKNEIIDFYVRFINYLKDMIKTGKENGYDLISIMGP